MSYLRWVCVLLLTGASAVSFAGDIQVMCEPGLRIFLDGKLVGTSSVKDDGFFVANVPEGAHSVRVEKFGFTPQLFRVVVGQLPVEVKVGAFIPEIQVRNERKPSGGEVRRLVGNLLVTSAPQDCEVVIDGEPRHKDTPLLPVEGLAAGEHSISFSKPGYQTISDVVSIQPGAEVTVRGDLQAGKVENVYTGKGSLRVITTPQYCTVRFLGKTIEKTDLMLNLSYVPAGERRIVVAWKRFELSSTIRILKGQRTVVVVSFAKHDRPFVVSYEPE